MSTQKRMILCRGLMGSGKTTWAKEFVAQQNREFVRWVNVNRDDTREALFGAYWAPEYKFKPVTERLVTEVNAAKIAEAFKAGLSVVVSDTNLSEKAISQARSIAAAHDVAPWDVSVNDTFMKVPPSVCVERDKLRAHPVTEKVIRRAFEKYRDLFASYGVTWDHSPEVVNTMKWRASEYQADTSLPKAFIFDVDGTLTEMSSVRGPFDYSKVDLDLPHNHVIELAQTLYAAGYAIVVCTGREGTDVCVKKTNWWLDEFGVKRHATFFRAKGDYRNDAVVKKEMFFRDIAPNYNVVGVFDDRKQVVDFWRSIGLPCYQVAPGDF